MLKIKLSRRGKKKYPVYRLIVSEVGRDPYGRTLEILGSYNPHTDAVQIDAERVKHWVDSGAQMTDTVNNLLVEHKIVEGKKVGVSKLTKKTRSEMQKKADSAKAAEKAVADKAAEPVVEAVAEAPVEEVKAE